EIRDEFSTRSRTAADLKRRKLRCALLRTSAHGAHAAERRAAFADTDVDAFAALRTRRRHLWKCLVDAAALRAVLALVVGQARHGPLATIAEEAVAGVTVLLALTAQRAPRQ